MFRGHPSNGTLSTAMMVQEEDDDDSLENSIVRGDEHKPPLSERNALSHETSPQTPPIPSVVFTDQVDEDVFTAEVDEDEDVFTTEVDEDKDDDEIPISFLLLNSIDVDERRIRDMQQMQCGAQKYQRLLERTQTQVDGLFHDLYESQQTTRDPVDINVRLANVNLRLANKLALLYREIDEPRGTEDLKGEAHCQHEKGYVSSAFLFPVVKLCLGFGMVMWFVSRGQALFPAAMIVWLWWVKESFF